MPINVCIFYVGFFAMIASCVFALGSGWPMVALLLIPSVKWGNKNDD